MTAQKRPLLLQNLPRLLHCLPPNLPRRLLSLLQQRLVQISLRPFPIGVENVGDVQRVVRPQMNASFETAMSMIEGRSPPLSHRTLDRQEDKADPRS